MVCAMVSCVLSTMCTVNNAKVTHGLVVVGRCRPGRGGAHDPLQPVHDDGARRVDTLL